MSVTSNQEAGSAYWSSRFAFILAATGSAVGLGNIWSFPYKAGEGGGGAFVLVYLICVMIVGLPIMMAEILLGRQARANPITAIEGLAKESGFSGLDWSRVGKIGVLAGFLILSFYSVVAGWVLSFVFRAFSGAFEGITATAAGEMFGAVAGDAERSMAWHTIFIIMTVILVSKGISGGLEKAIKIMMPVLFVMLAMLVGLSSSIGDFGAALNYLFVPDFSKLTPSTMMSAMGQAFFSLSLGMGAILMYGAYLPNNASIGRVSLAIVGMDTLVAILAGLAIFPLVFSIADVSPEVGGKLVFVVLPQVFGQIEGGTIIATMFFGLLFVAALTSAVSLLEPAVSWLTTQKGMERTKATRLAGFGVWLLGMGTVFSESLWSEAKLTVAPKVGEKIYVFFENKSFFDIVEYVSSSIMLPLGGILIAYFVGFKLKEEIITEQMKDLPEWEFKLWRFFIRNVAPIAALLVFLYSTGIWAKIQLWLNIGS